MRAVVLLSAGRHPLSARPAPVPVEMQAIALARGLGADVAGLHAGAPDLAVREALGQGMDRVTVLRIGEADDAVAALAAALAADPPDLVLAGNRGRGGEDSGLLPYLLAEALGWPIAANAVALAAAAEGLAVIQARARGARWRLVVAPPAVVTVHPAAPPALPFAYARARRGRIEEQEGRSAPLVPRVAEERPYRPRPRVIGVAGGGSAAERLRAATEVAGGGRVLVDPPPEEAARELLAWLRALGFSRSADE